MSDDKPLQTFLQISDLHIGEIDPLTGDAAISKFSERLFAQFTWLDGVLGHHAPGLKDLAEYFASLVDQGFSPLLLVTGDITRIGGEAEYDTADRFLGSQVDLNPPNQNWVGLDAKDWREQAIPGNHDHWSGKPTIWGGPPVAFPKYFANFRPPNVPTICRIPLFDNRALQIARINTDADVSPWGLSRARAVGSFQSQLAALKNRWGRLKNGTIRVLMMHHSWDRRGFLLSIDKSTRQALEAFLVATQTRILLTGHTHEPLLKSFIAKHDGESQDVLECRCGTTTQVDDVPLDWRKLVGSFPRRTWPANSLLLHRLYREGDRVRWEAQTIVRTNKSGFKRVLDQNTVWL